MTKARETHDNEKSTRPLVMDVLCPLGIPSPKSYGPVCTLRVEEKKVSSRKLRHTSTVIEQAPPPRALRKLSRLGL